MRTRQNEGTTRSSARIKRVAAKSVPAKPAKITKPQSRSSARAHAQKNAALLLEQFQKQEDVDTNFSSILFKHPREIFDLIASHLAPEWLVCLSLTCKLALQYIGTDCWKLEDVRRRALYSRKDFLETLVRDAPEGLTYCAFCNTLHSPLKPPRLHRETRLTKICMSQWAIVDYFIQVRDPQQEHGYNLLHPHIESVFQTRDNATPTSSSTSLLEAHYKSASHPSFSYEFNASASWIDNRLILKHTHAFHPHPHPRTNLTLQSLLSLPLRLCPHLSTLTTPPQKGRYLKGQPLNSPLLPHALASAFPPPAAPPPPNPVPSAPRRPRSRSRWTRRMPGGT